MAAKSSFSKLLTFLLLTSLCHADEYGKSRQKLIDAYQRQDYVAMQAAANESLQHRPHFPAALYNLSLAQLLNGDRESSLQTLAQLAAMSIDFSADKNDAFQRLHVLPGWRDLNAKIQQLRQPVGDPVVAFSMEQKDFVPEGIAITPKGDLLLGSIRYGTLYKVVADGSSQLLSDGATARHWSVFGITVTDDDSAWFASAAVPQYIGYDELEEGRTGLYRLNIRSGTITARAVLPEDDKPHVFGDVIHDQSGRLYTTDSLGGAVMSYDPETRAFAEVIAPGILSSPQGLALDTAENRLYVADYNGGIYCVGLGKSEVRQVTGRDDLSLYGIDGLYWYEGQLIAIQNGVQPNRIVRLNLSEDGLAVSDHEVLAMNLPQFDEPTLGVVHGDNFYFVANSHWNRFTNENELPANLSGPIILQLDLRQ